MLSRTEGGGKEEESGRDGRGKEEERGEEEKKKVGMDIGTFKSPTNPNGER